jgi:tripartite-type tricarboxylate transporter receptor subunit TctC
MLPRRSLLAGLAPLPPALAVPAALAQELPADRPIRIVVPTGAGGITDILARIVANRLAQRLGRPVVVDNRPGASGIIGTEAVVRSRPDGTTLLMVYPSHPVNPALKARLPYDTERDLAPISTVTTVALVLLVPRDGPDRDVAGLIARAKRERLNYASVGSGSLAHLAAALFCSTAGIEMTHVPFRSAPEAHTALMRGEVAMFLDPPITTLPLLAGNQVRAIGVSTRERLASLPEIPTIAEAALPGYAVLGWNGLLAPAGTPAPIITLLNREVVAILGEPEVRAQLDRQGTMPAPCSPEEFAALIRADIAKWARVVREAGIQPD